MSNTNKKITNAMLISFIKILDGVSKKKMPQKISYAITKNIINLSKEYECYITELEKIFNEYSNNFVLDDNGNKTFDVNGIPIVQDNVKENYFNSLNNLLNLDIEVTIYTIDDKYFDYDDSDNRYDILSPIEMIQLQNIICDGDNNE